MGSHDYSLLKSPKIQNQMLSIPPSQKYGFGTSLLQKMRYKIGQGLGLHGQGILNPIEGKPRPPRMGLGIVKKITAKAKVFVYSPTGLIKKMQNSRTG